MVAQQSLNKKLTKTDYAKIANKIEEFISSSVTKKSAKGVVIGLSGGLDSSVVLMLSACALGPERVTAFVMPGKSTPKEDIKHAVELAEMTKVNYTSIDIQPIVEQYTSLLSANDKKAIGNLTARIRMTLLYYHAFIQGRLVAGTGDKSEYYIGYFTKHGDGGADIMPIADLYKTQVRELARYLNVPEKIVEKRSSPRLWDDQLAEEEIGMNYETIDSILYQYLDKNVLPRQIIKSLAGRVSLQQVSKILEMINNSSHKRGLPPICRISSR